MVTRDWRETLIPDYPSPYDKVLFRSFIWVCSPTKFRQLTSLPLGQQDRAKVRQLGRKLTVNMAKLWLTWNLSRCRLPWTYPGISAITKRNTDFMSRKTYYLGLMWDIHSNTRLYLSRNDEFFDQLWLLSDIKNSYPHTQLTEKVMVPNEPVLGGVLR